ncbi:MAG: carbohydrate ABC transporter permease [Anaerolineae bacterium]|nr:carbohydrate ABC transporter permease [Anaerolineae bacterium]
MSAAAQRLLHPVWRALLYAALIAWAVVDIYPMIWTALTSVKTNREYFDNPFGLPAEWHFQNYPDAWSQGRMNLYFLNTVALAAGVVLLSLALASSTSFVFARFRFRGSWVLWTLLMAGFLMPVTTRMVPIVVFMRRLGLYGNMLSIIVVLAAAAVPFSAFFLRAYMETIPRELEEAAIVDGANMWQVYTRIILPLAQPALATLGTFNFITAWNEFTMVILLSRSDSTFTLPVGIRFLNSSRAADITGTAAGLVITIVPVALVFLFLQRFVVKGMTAGALKG